GVRLLTLTGAGGSGKTRLALQAATQLLKAFPDGVWLVELAPLSDPALVPQTLLSTLGLIEPVGRPALAVLTDFLRAKHALLLLDNCEHLIQACAQLAETLLHACPKLQILATGREALGVPGEMTFSVPTLSTPDTYQLPALEALNGYEAVRLFVERAQTALSGFLLTSDNALAVAQVCHRLDGIPLAIELAAARAKVLRVEQIAARLDDRFRLLTSGSRTALPRHQTLQALIDWSYDLLSEPERVLLRRLSVFAGGWTLEAAEDVCAGEQGSAGAGEHTPAPLLPISPASILDLLTSLVNKSLVLSERKQGQETRYRLLETIRQYALAKLAASRESDAVRQRHAEYFLALAESIAGLNAAPSWWSDRMETEHDNLRAALACSQQAVDGAELGLRLAGMLWWFWWSRGYWNEGCEWLERVLAHPGAVHYPGRRADALGSLGFMLACQGDFATGQARLAESLKLYQELGNLSGSAQVLFWLGFVARERGDATTARLRLEESLAAFREIGYKDGVADVLNTLGEVLVMQEEAAAAEALLEESLALARQLGELNQIGWALNHLGHAAQLQGKYERAAHLHEESLPLFRQIGPHHLGIPWAHQGLGETALAQGDAALATTYFTEALPLYRYLGDRAGIAWCLAGLAGAAAVDEEPERAAWLWGAAEALRQSIGAREAPASRATRERLIAQAREQLGDEAFDAAWAEGGQATMEQAIEDVLETPHS
ncbi:MAG: tetratricopeptide repeat protein, partial [Armatimonadetes bacterium]|nr:tetratricopeptide repeat protein [Armatimonadota bacterium]